MVSPVLQLSPAFAVPILQTHLDGCERLNQELEALFLERVSPWAKVADLDDSTLRRLVAQARKLMRLNSGGGQRRTRFALNPAEGMWVDERTGLPCHVCGTPVAWGYHPNEFRKSWYCPTCQNVVWAPTTAEAIASGVAEPGRGGTASGGAWRSSRTPPQLPSASRPGRRRSRFACSPACTPRRR